MGKNQKKKEPPQWRFELHQSVDALVPVPSPRGGKKGGGKRSGAGLEELAEKPPNSDWDQIDPAVFCELVPTLPQDLVFSMCASERAAGTPVQAALDRLLALSLSEEAGSSGQGPSQPTLRVARGVSVRVPQEEAAGAPVPRPSDREGDMGSLRLWALPVEICGEICATLGGASPATLGRLAQSCTGCRAVVAAWLRHDVGSAGLGLGSNHCFGVGGAAWWAPVAAPSACVQGSMLRTDAGHTARFRLSVPGSWGGERSVRLARQCGSLQLLAMDCQAHGGFGAAAVAALWARESARLLGDLRALRLLGCHEADEARLVSLAHRCPQLTALDLSGCAQLSADALPALATLPHLRALSLASNPQLSAAALQALLRGCPSLRVADLSHCDGAPPGHASLRTAPHHSLFGAEHLSPPPPAPPQPAAAAAPPPPPRAPAARGAARAGWGALPLQELYLRGWVRLTALSLGSGCVRLASLDLSSCVSLGSLQLQLPALTTLSATTCPKLEMVLLECPALHSLSLAQARLLHALQADRSTELQSLNLYGCRQLTASHLSALLRVAGASLRALNLNGAFGTEEVSRELILQSCPRLALLDDKGRVRKH